MNKEELQEIISTNPNSPDSFKWIKVKRFDENEPRDQTRYLYSELKEHHKIETNFLINKCKELAAQILKLENQYEVLFQEHSKIYEELHGLNKNE